MGEGACGGWGEGENKRMRMEGLTQSSVWLGELYQSYEMWRNPAIYLTCSDI